MKNMNAAQALAGLVEMERRVRACDSPEALGWLMVNDTCQLVPYRQAAFWQAGSGKVQALSGVGMPDRHAPFVVWLTAWVLSRVRMWRASSPQQGGVAGVAEGSAAVDAKAQGGGSSGRHATCRLIDASMLTGDDARMWQEHLPAYGLWVNLCSADGQSAGVLLFWRETPWQAQEIALLESLSDAWAHAWRALQRRGGKTRRPRNGARRWLWVGAAALLVLALLPVRQSVLAPAEVAASRPAMIRAPLQGVVDQVAVQPNQVVQAGQLLLQLDARELESQLETARQSLAVAAAELRQGQQQALLDPRGKAMLGLLQGKRDQAAADVDYLTQALARSQIHAPRAGIVIFDDPNDWIGRPVALGERIMMLADPQDAELEVFLPVADAITLAPDADVRLFLNIAPTAPLDARLVRMGYRASPTPDGVLAYRVRAAFTEATSPPRIGLKGTAKLYGERTTLFMYVMRRPLTALRTWMGW